MKKIILRIILVVAIVFVLIKIFGIFILSNIYIHIEKFRNEPNRYYSVAGRYVTDDYIQDELFVKEEIVKYVNRYNNEITYCEWKDFYSGKEYSIDFKNKKFTQNDSLIKKKKFLMNMPNFIADIYQDEEYDITKIFEIRYIIPIKYNEQFCYKISTKTEIIIIHAKTYLPVYSNVKTVNSDSDIDNGIGNFYEFKVGQVKDEDMTMPDITGFEEIKK